MDKARILVFSPTYRPGGLDVLEGSMARQERKDFVWIVCDELYSDRWREWSTIEDRTGMNIQFIHPDVLFGNKRNLCAAYNEAADIAVAQNFDLFVTLQDYMYIDGHGLDRFWEMYESKPNDLYTGVTHISLDPFKTKIADPFGHYSIFAEPYFDKPKRLSWEDVRVTQIYPNHEPGEKFGVQVGHWEANWAAVPVSLLKKGSRWNIKFDRGIAYENMDFAKACNRDWGSNVWLDSGNVAISLPHKDYFEGEREEIERYSNKEFYESIWGPS
jgi:hypothetical protein